MNICHVSKSLPTLQRDLLAVSLKNLNGYRVTSQRDESTYGAFPLCLTNAWQIWATTPLKGRHYSFIMAHFPTGPVVASESLAHGKKTSLSGFTYG